MKERLTIDKGISIPPVVRQKSMYPFAEMLIGDSVFIPKKKRGGNIVQYAKNFIPQSQWSCRSENGGVRIWRVK